MTTSQICKHLKIKIWQLRELQKKLKIKGEGVGHSNDFSSLEVARMKAGVKYKDYFWTVDRDRFWIYYGFCPNGLNEIKIEI